MPALHTPWRWARRAVPPPARPVPIAAVAKRSPRLVNAARTATRSTRPALSGLPRPPRGAWQPLLPGGLPVQLPSAGCVPCICMLQRLPIPSFAELPGTPPRAAATRGPAGLHERVRGSDLAGGPGGHPLLRELQRGQGGPWPPAARQPPACTRIGHRMEHRGMLRGRTLRVAPGVASSAARWGILVQQARGPRMVQLKAPSRR